MTTLTVVATFTARPGQEQALAAMLSALVGPTRAEVGCVRYELSRSTEQPGTFLFSEIWQTRAHWQAHMAMPHLAAFLADHGALTEHSQLFVGEPVLP